MTAPNPYSRRSSPETRGEQLADWFALHQKKITIGVGALAVIGAGYWFYDRSRTIKATRAEDAYYAAQRSLMSGNVPLAQSDFRKLITRYDGTSAALRGRMVLAQTLYDAGKVQEGITELERGREAASGGELAASYHVVLAGGYEQLRKFAEAAREFERAAEAARFDADKDRYRSLAANAYIQAGNREAARRIWSELAADSKSVVAGEARLRLGEYFSQPQPAS